MMSIGEYGERLKEVHSIVRPVCSKLCFPNKTNQEQISYGLLNVRIAVRSQAHTKIRGSDARRGRCVRPVE